MTKTKPSKNGTGDILGAAILVKVHMGVWEARKHDQKVTHDVNEEYGASQDAGRYHKHLFGGSVKEHGEVLTAATRIRALHYEQTLPWLDSGWRILPTMNHFAYNDAMRDAISTYLEKRDAMVAKYGRIVREAEERLGPKLYKRADYPSAEAVRRRYYAELEFAPVPAGGDFRTDLPKTELERLAKHITERRAEAVKIAMTEAWQRLGDVIVELRDRLKDGKRLRASMVERVRSVAEVLGRLNVTDDPTLAAACSAALKNLGSLDVEALRKNKPGLTEAAASADDILAKMKGMYTPPAKKGKEAK